MDTYGVDVLHATDSNGGVVLVTHHLELDLLVTLDALLNEYLVYGRENQCVTHNLAQLLLIVGKATTGTTKGKCRTKHYRVTNLLGSLNAILHSVHNN